MTNQVDCGAVSKAKECRLCGVDDESNINIFTNSFDSRGLATKINTVYPIVLYQNDPLPKNICQTCVLNVNYVYNEIEKVLKLNNKWIKKLQRDLHCENNYIKVLDIIKHAKRSARKTIRSSLGEDICEHAINRKLMGINSQSSSKKRKKLKRKSDGTPPTTDEDKPTTRISAKKSPESVCKIDDLKTQLELNGCTLLEVSAKKCKVETNETPTFQCPCCPCTCESLHELARHQITHMQLQLPKIYEKKCLSKELRHGRLMSNNGRKCIRCLNCWRVFGDNAAILDHWSLAECEYYCRVCGKEYPLTPKMLREHVPAAHGIRYRSTKLPIVVRDKSSQLETNNYFKLQRDIGVASTCHEPPNADTSRSDTCNVCFQVFKNFKARNSHMRIHKASTHRKNRVAGQRRKGDTTPQASEPQNGINAKPRRGVRIKFVQFRPTANGLGPSSDIKSMHAPTNGMGPVIIHQPMCEVKKEPNELYSQ